MSKEEIKAVEFKKNIFFTDRVILTSLVFLGLFILVSWILWYVLYQQISFAVGMPAYFSFLQPYNFIYRYVLPLFVSIMAVFHLLLAFFAYDRDRLVSYVVLGGAAFLALLVVVTGVYYMSFA